MPVLSPQEGLSSAAGDLFAPSPIPAHTPRSKNRPKPRYSRRPHGQGLTEQIRRWIHTYPASHHTVEAVIAQFHCSRAYALKALNTLRDEGLLDAPQTAYPTAHDETQAPLAFHRRLYLAGPMTGIPEHNFPAFNAEAARLRSLGHHVTNPAELNSCGSRSWREAMQLDITALIHCDAVALLPGWRTSKGANLERHIALSLGMPVFMSSLLQTTTQEGRK